VSESDAILDARLKDPVGHLRANHCTWITSAPEEVVRALLRWRKHIDSNLRKPPPPSGWRPIRTIAQELNLCSGHLARQCRDIYAAQDLARICTIRGHNTWCLAPSLIDTLRATHALANASAVLSIDLPTKTHGQQSVGFVQANPPLHDPAPTSATQDVIGDRHTEGSSK
jgi:hypothetical protein